MKSRNGFEISGQTYYRLDKGMGFDEEDAVSRYNAKVQLELAWKFFNSSFFKRKGKAHEIQLENKIAQNRFERDLHAAHSGDMREKLRLRYERQTAGLLIHRIENLNLLYTACLHLLDKGDVSSDELLNVLADKTEAERILAGFSETYEAADNLAIPHTEVVQIDTLSLMSDIKENHFDFQDIRLRGELLEQRYRNTNYFQDATLSPFARYSHYFRPEMKNSSNVDVGIRLRLPLSDESRLRRKSLAVEKQLLSLDSVRAELQISVRIRHIVGEINRLNKMSVGEIRRIHEMKEFLALRKRAYDNRIGEYSLPARMKEYNVYLSCWEKLVDLQYQRDYLINDLQSLLGDLSIEDYCVETKL